MTEAQRDSLVTRCEEIRTAVDEALPNLSTRRRRSVEDLRPVAALRNLIHDHGEVLPPVVLRLLRHGVCLLCEAKHEFDARRKRSAFERARVAVAHAVGHILIAAKGDTSPVRFELEQEVLPAISGLVRWSERRRR